MAFVLIDNERLKVMKVTKSLEAAEYWTEILCRNTDTTLDTIDNRRFLSKYTDMELRMMYYNATGQVITPQTEYAETLKLVYEQVIMSSDLDETPISVLKEILGRDLRHDPAPVVHGPDNSVTKAATAPKNGASGVSRTGSGGSSGEAPQPPKGGTTARVWEIASAKLEELGSDDIKTLRKSILDACEAEGINSSTAGTQYSKWKRHQSLS